MGSELLERLAQSLKSLGTFMLVPWGLISSARKCWPNPSSTRLGKTLVGRLVIGLEEVLAERIVGEAVPHQDPLQLGMAGEPDAHHVVDFALLEIGPAVDVVERRDLALAPRPRPSARAARSACPGWSCCRAGS